MRAFKQRILYDEAFGLLAVRWRLLYQNLCGCGLSNAEARLGTAYNRVSWGVELPPSGPPLVGSQHGNPEDDENLPFVSQEEAFALVDKYSPFLRQAHAAPLLEYVAQGLIWVRYRSRQGYGRRGGPPGLRIGWQTELLRAFFAYKCQNCGYEFRASNPPGGGGPSGGGPPPHPPPGRPLPQRDPLTVIAGMLPGAAGSETARSERASVRQTTPAPTRRREIEPIRAMAVKGLLQQSPDVSCPKITNDCPRTSSRAAKNGKQEARRQPGDETGVSGAVSAISAQVGSSRRGRICGDSSLMKMNRALQGSP